MAITFWAEAGLSNDSQVRDIDAWSNSLQTNLRGALDDEHLFSSSTGTADRGIHRVGSGRAFVAAQSALSTSNTTQGRLFFASDTSRLFITPVSGATAFVGTPYTPEVLAYGNNVNPTNIYPGQNIRWVMECGERNTGSGSVVVTFANTYNTPPLVFASAFTRNTSVVDRHMVRVNIESASSFLLFSFNTGGTQVGTYVAWHSLGTASF